ncbi:hypothetical protein GIB67_031403 [Kingdonia uniflora]|uniref:No apical meristem-associated C-terminal domain-containing protein n=1 Tax=Kingdonia uniflora TaxID=39325 RepID=A0A7J7MB18_9MAGN|nr:hypothetical protein GIB67_031403 [Kingdonia uniflora]
MVDQKSILGNAYNNNRCPDDLQPISKTQFIDPLFFYNHDIKSKSKTKPQPQAFSPYYQPYPLTQPQGFQSPNYFQNYQFHGESTQHSQSDANASIPVKAVAPQKDKRKGRKKRAPTGADFTCLTREWVTTSVNVNGRTKGFTFYQKANIAFNRDPECPTRRSCGSTKSQWYALNAQCVAYKGIVAQERFRNSSGKTKEDQENDAHKIYKGLNGGNDFKHHEAYKILAREPRWANLRDDGLNHAVNIPRNVARRTSDNSSPGDSVGSNNLSEVPDGPPIPQSAGPNSDLDGSLYEGGSRPISQKLYRKNITSQKALEGVTASGSGVHALLDELRLEKIQANQEKERRIAEAIQHWQAKMDLEQTKKDCKIMAKNLSTLSGHQLQYYLQRQAEIMERLANRGRPGT